MLNPHAWELASWQNVLATAFLLVWTIVIAKRKRRTPIEVIFPSLDRKFVMAFRSGRWEVSLGTRIS
jgi:hypothetical protein